MSSITRKIDKNKATVIGLRIEESDSQFEIAIEGGDNLAVMLLWFDAFALQVVSHGRNGIGGRRKLGG